MIQIGKALYRARLAIHRNQFYFESVGISQRAVSRIERGEKFPPPNEVDAMIRHLGVDEKEYVNIYLLHSRHNITR